MSRRVVLVTGGAGFIGSNIVAKLTEDAGLDVAVCDWLGDAADAKWRNIARHPISDLIAPEQMFAWLDSHREALEAVVHMGAVSSTTEPDVDKIVRNNFALSRDLFRWCAENRARMIYASSAATYGDGAAGFDDDNEPAALAALRPLNAYGWSKALFDLYATRQSAWGNGPPQCAGLKFFNVYGPNELHKGAMKSVVAHIWPDVAAGRAVKLFRSHNPGYADGGQLRDFVYVRDAAEVVSWLIGRPDVSGVFNLGSGHARSFKHLAEAVFKAAGAAPRIEYVDMPAELQGRYQYFTEAKIERLRAAGYEGQLTGLEEGVGDYVGRFLSKGESLSMSDLTVSCCIAGGGPAGMMLGLLLARAGVEVAVLEKHADFLRDFRGDTVHPSTMEVLNELGLYDEFRKTPHEEVDQLSAEVGGEVIQAGDFRHLPTRSKFMAIMPQWDFLNFLAEEAKKYKEFCLIMEARVTDLVRDGDRVTGLRAMTPTGPIEIAAALVVGADGRDSTVRDLTALKVTDLGAPMDVLWMRLPREPQDEGASLGHAVAGAIFVLIPRGDYFQCGYVVAKGAAEAIQAKGIEAFRRSIEEVVPRLKGRTEGLKSWDDVKLLSVTVDRLETWAAPGLLCIGDAAHAMSPVGGVGINLAIQDAVAAANLLYTPLRTGTVSLADLGEVQRRREWPTKVTQAVQLFIQKRMIAPTLDGGTPRALWPAKLLNAVPYLRRFPAAAVGLGARPEHVRSPDLHRAG